MLVCAVRVSKMTMLPHIVPILYFQHHIIDCPHYPYIVLVSKQPADANGFLPCHSGAHFLSLARGWENTMTNTTHIHSIADS